ncbi:MAG: hypothetical protein ACF8CQ_13495 [Rhodopirellula sp. JB044]
MQDGIDCEWSRRRIECRQVEPSGRYLFKRKQPRFDSGLYVLG